MDTPSGELVLTISIVRLGHRGAVPPSQMQPTATTTTATATATVTAAKGQD